MTQYLQRNIKDSSSQLAMSIRTARKRRGWTIAEMAEKIEVTPRTVTRLEHGDHKVNLGIVLSALIVLGMVDKLTHSIEPDKDLIGQEKERARLFSAKRKAGQTKVEEIIDLSSL